MLDNSLQSYRLLIIIHSVSKVESINNCIKFSTSTNTTTTTTTNYNNDDNYNNIKNSNYSSIIRHVTTGIADCTSVAFEKEQEVTKTRI